MLLENWSEKYKKYHTFILVLEFNFQANSHFYRAYKPLEDSHYM